MSKSVVAPVDADGLYEYAKGFLSRTGEEGRSVFDFLSEFLARVIKERPRDPVKSLEIYISEYKYSSSSVATTLKPVLPSEVDERVVSVSKAVQSLVSSSSGVLPLEEEVAMWQSSGVGMSEEELYSTLFSVRVFAKEKELNFARFFGKILGSKKHYYVCETEHVDESEYERFDICGREVKDGKGKPIPMEEPGTGQNSYTYWVCNSPGEKWTPLPDITPAQIVISRKIRKYFTGDLDSEISSYPEFPGKEAEYLRAQIGRIAAGTSIAPLGLYSEKPEPEAPDEETPAPPKIGPWIVKNESFGGVEGEMTDLANWIHVLPLLLKNGRCTNPKKEQEEEDGGEEEVLEEPKGELGALAEDVAVLVQQEDDENVTEVSHIGSVPAWIVRSSSSLVPENDIITVNSLRWPGMCAASSAGGKISGCMYVGFGHKDEEFSPLAPPTVLTESAPLMQQVEPEMKLSGDEQLTEEGDKVDEEQT